MFYRLVRTDLLFVTLTLGINGRFWNVVGGLLTGKIYLIHDCNSFIFNVLNENYFECLNFFSNFTESASKVTPRCLHFCGSSSDQAREIFLLRFERDLGIAKSSSSNMKSTSSLSSMPRHENVLLCATGVEVNTVFLFGWPFAFGVLHPSAANKHLVKIHRL